MIPKELDFEAVLDRLAPLLDPQVGIADVEQLVLAVSAFDRLYSEGPYREADDIAFYLADRCGYRPLAARRVADAWMDVVGMRTLQWARGESLRRRVRRRASL